MNQPPQFPQQPQPNGPYGAPPPQQQQFPQSAPVQAPQYGNGPHGGGPAQPQQPMQPQRPVQPMGMPPTPVTPLRPPEDGRVVVEVNRMVAAAIGIACVVVAIGIIAWLQYDGALFEFDNGAGRVTKGSILIHILPIVLAVVAIMQLVKLLDNEPKLIFEGGGVQVRDKTTAEGVARVPWSAIGRVYVHESVAVDKKGKPRKNQSPSKKWVVEGRDGKQLAGFSTSGHKPDPDIGLGQVAAIAQGRALVG